MAMFTTAHPAFRLNHICHKCGSAADGIPSTPHSTLRELAFGSNPGLMLYTYCNMVCCECGSPNVAQFAVT